MTSGGPISDQDLDRYVRLLLSRGLDTPAQIVHDIGPHLVTLERASAALKRVGVDA